MNNFNDETLFDALWWNLFPSEQLMAMLKQEKIGLNEQNKYGRTVLHLAAIYCEKHDKIMILLKADALGNIEDEHEKKPFDYIKDNNFLVNSPAYKALEDAKNNQ